MGSLLKFHEGELLGTPETTAADAPNGRRHGDGFDSLHEIATGGLNLGHNDSVDARRDDQIHRIAEIVRDDSRGAAVLIGGLVLPFTAARLGACIGELLLALHITGLLGFRFVV